AAAIASTAEPAASAACRTSSSTWPILWRPRDHPGWSLLTCRAHGSPRRVPDLRRAALPAPPRHGEGAGGPLAVADQSPDRRARRPVPVPGVRDRPSALDPAGG